MNKGGKMDGLARVKKNSNKFGRVKGYDFHSVSKR